MGRFAAIVIGLIGLRTAAAALDAHTGPSGAHSGQPTAVSQAIALGGEVIPAGGLGAGVAGSAWVWGRFHFRRISTPYHNFTVVTPPSDRTTPINIG
jgi:hypothetical protein